MTSPTGTAHSPASTSENGKPMPHPCEMCPSMKPPIPASDICASETCPTYPVSTTTDSAMQVTVSDEMNAKRNTLSSTSRSRRPATKQAAAVRTGEPGRPTDGLRCAAPPPRARTDRERTAITTMITRNGMASGRPCWGSHVHTVISFSISDCTQPISRPAMRDDPEGFEAADEGGGQGRDDEQRVRGRVEVRDRSDHDPGGARQDCGDHPVLKGDPVGRDPGQRRPAVVLGAGPSGQPEAGIAVDQRQRDRDDEHDAREIQSILRERDAGDRQRGAGEDRVGGDRLGAVVEDGDRLEGEHHPDGGAHPGERRGPAQRPVREHVQHAGRGSPRTRARWRSPASC